MEDEQKPVYRETRPKSPSKVPGKAPPGTPLWKPPSQQSAQYPVPKPGEPIMDENNEWLPPIDPTPPDPEAPIDQRTRARGHK